MKKNILIVAAFLSVHLLFLFKLKFTAWPEMLLWPYLILKGWLPYQDIAIVHTPHLIADLALFYKVFGLGITQLRIFTFALIIISDILIYWVASKIWTSKIARISLAIFIVWQLFFDGNGLWFDLMLVPLSLIAFYFLETKKYFWAGIIWALMFFTKQTAIWFLIPIFFTFIANKKTFYSILKSFIWGTIAAFVIWSVILLMWGVLPHFYNWAIYFGIFILPKASGQIQLPALKTLAVALFPFALFIPFALNKKSHNLNLLFWSIAGLMGAYPRFEYFHFQPGIPFLAIASSLVLVGLENKKVRFKVFIVVYLLGSLYLFANFFLRNWGEGIRFLEPDVTGLSNYVKTNTKPGDRIFVMNWWDSIYALSETLPATKPWVPQLAWYQEIPGIQAKEVSDLRSSQPKLILLQDYQETGLSSYKPQQIYDYVMANYRLKEKVDGIEILVQKNENNFLK